VKLIITIATAVFGLALSSPSLAQQQFQVLLFTKTAAWHHDSSNAAVEAVEKLGKLHNFGVFWTEDANRVFNDRELAKYKVVIFAQTTGDILNAEQEAAMQRFIRAGGGFVGVHSASDTEYDWEWYTKMVGHMFKQHPAVQTATLQVLKRDFPGMDRFAPRFLYTDEWYEFDEARVPSLNYILAIDENTYQVSKALQGRAPMLRPVSWYQEYDGGRAFYTALGHLSAIYSDPAFLHHLYGGIYWAASGKGFKAQ
jgi:type 1 glutamine amidotransferase